ncbi:MAG: SpoIIE family protein phosphatase [Acidobacteriota bacterium]
MDILTETLRNQLLERKHRLNKFASAAGPDNLLHLLRQVDAALERLDEGSFGICEVCHEEIEPERLLANPLVRTCLGDLDSNEREALQRDLDLLAQVQENLLPPRHQQFDGWEVCFDYKPFRVASGDYCDVISGRDALNVLIGDVSGKGVAASMLVANLHGLFRTLLPDGCNLAASLARANRIFSESTIISHYATLLAMRAEPEGRVSVANAGHCTPYLITREKVVPISSASLPLGVFADASFQVSEFELKPGDAVFAYTDGLSEARNEMDQEYGSVRLEGWLRTASGLTPQEMVKGCLADLEAFRSATGLADDLSILLLMRR